MAKSKYSVISMHAITVQITASKTENRKLFSAIWFGKSPSVWTRVYDVIEFENITRFQSSGIGLSCTLR